MNLELGHIQGNVLAGFNKDHQTFLFLRLPGDAQHSRAWLASVVSDVASHTEVAAFNALYKQVQRRQDRAIEGTVSSLWMNLAFTRSGLARLGHREEIGSQPAAFREGLARRARALGHVGASGPRHWLDPFRTARAIDVVMIVAGDSAAAVQARIVAYVNGIGTFGGSEVLRLQGDARADEPGHEHFGFKDGISQPGVRGVTVPNPADPNQGMPGQDLIWPGEFVLGYPRQSRSARHPDRPGRIAAARPPWTKNGSFLVFQRLTQDVPAFRTTLAQLAQAHAIGRELLGASFVGRHASGCPLELIEVLGDVGQTIADVGPTDPRVLSEAHINDFEFQCLDPSGHFVPRAAHIRKVYPRDEDPPGEVETQTHRLLRRGIAFGASYRARARPGSPMHGDSERGLLFACYQSSIRDQFEFVQASLGNPDFPRPGDGVDPILNERAPATTTIPRALPTHVSLQPFVRMTGGAYFFAPSIPALRMLAGVP